jgi:sulfonate transport system substrate-binding protein
LLVSSVFLTGADAAGKELAVTYVRAPLNIPSILEKRLGLLEEEFGPLGYTLSHPEITSGAQQTQAIAAGSIQVANCVGGISVLLAASQGLDIRIAGIYSRSPLSFCLLVRDPAIKTAADLKGKKVAGPKGTVLHQLLLSGISKAGLTALDVEHIEMPIPTAVSALMSGSIDGALAAGPGAQKAVESGARVLFNGEGLVEGTIVIGIGGKALEEMPELPQRMLAVHKKALAYADEHPEEALKIVSEEVEIPPEQVREMAKLYDFDPEIREQDVKELEATMKFLIDQGLAVKYIDPASLFVR